jgi:hypothetical protein
MDDDVRRTVVVDMPVRPITLRLVGPFAAWARLYQMKHGCTPVDAGRRAFNMLRFVDDMGPDERLAVYNVKTGTVELVEIDYRDEPPIPAASPRRPLWARMRGWRP